MPGIRYKIGERIGAGGMAEVFRASLEGTQAFARTVAVKRLLPEAAANPRHAEMFGNEARILAALHHANVVAVSDFTRDDDGGLLLAMELVEGVDLRELVRTGPVPLPVAIYIAGELLRGLGYIHDRTDPEGSPLGLVHGDVSAGNVLLSWDGAVKLCDFGLARACAGRSVGDAAVHGTPCYMSPEQLQGAPLDRRTDLYAVGVLLYELLTGKAPFAGASRHTTIAAILRHRVEPPRDLRPEIPADLEAIVMHLLEGERARRPDSAAAVIDVLDRCAAASHLWSSMGPSMGRKQLEALLRARFPAQGAGGRDDVDARRDIPRSAVPNRAPRVVVVPDTPRHAPGAAAHQAAAAHRRTVTAARGHARRAWAAAALVLFLGSATGSLLLGRDARPARQTEATPPATRMDATSTPIAVECSNAPRDTRATEASDEVQAESPMPTSIVQPGASPARVTRDSVIHPSRPGAPSPVVFFVPEPQQ